MIIKQLSVFLENKTGRINDVVHTLGTNGINMHAFSMAETADFGILRLIVSDVDKAVEVLREKNFAVMSTDVVCLSCANVPGSLAVVLEYLPKSRFSLSICMLLHRPIRLMWLSSRMTCRNV